MGVLLCGSGHGRLRLGLRAFHALLGGGLLAFELGGGDLDTLLGRRKCTFSLGAGEGGGGLGGQESPVTPSKSSPAASTTPATRSALIMLTPTF